MFWVNLLSRLNAIKTILGTPASSDIATKVDTLHDTRITAARAGYLDLLNTYLDAKISDIKPELPPMTGGLYGRPTSQTSLQGVGNSAPSIAKVTASETAYDTWKTVLTVSGAGIIEALGVYQVANASDRDVQARLSVDGNVVWTSDANAWQTGSGDNTKGFWLVGGTANVGVAVGRLPFRTSFTVEFKKTENATGTVEMGVAAQYYRTS